jgi:peptide chain release factor 3
MGTHFKGVYNLVSKSLNVFTPGKQKLTDDYIEFKELNDENLKKRIGERETLQLQEDVELIDGVYPSFDKERYMMGDLAPVYFGSAVNNFGVQELLDTFVELAPTPRSRETSTRMVEPSENKFTGFVFKIHANLDPKHRDRIAFVRVCSGEFKRNKFYHHVRSDKELRFNNPTTFMASQKNIIEEAYPGDVVGLYDTGNFKIGDTLTEGESFMFKGIPSFSPEIFKELINIDPMKSKQLEKGIQQLTDEGLASLFVQELGNRKFVGTVGELQFEVLQYRLEHEYGAKCRFEARSIYKACWMSGEEADLKDFMKYRQTNIAYDKDNQPVFLAETGFILRMAEEKYPNITFHTTSEFKV